MSNQKETEQTFTVVAFRYDQKNSILYKNLPYPISVGAWVEKALKDFNADVISVRRVYEKRPIQE